MSQHIEWADAPRALFADASWVEENADNGNDAGDVALVFDTGSGAVAFSGTPDELRRTVTSMTARLDTFAPVETGRAADETLDKLAELVRGYDTTRAEFGALHARDQTGAECDRYADAIFTFAHEFANIARKATP